MLLITRAEGAASRRSSHKWPDFVLTGQVSEWILTTVSTATPDSTAGPARPARPRKRHTADERRDQILQVAAKIIARDGMHGASTAEIAREAGISHAYLFRIFPTKEALQIAVAADCGMQMHATMMQAGERARARGEEPLVAMGQAFQDFLADRTRLRVSLQAIAAAESIPALGTSLRASWELVISDLERVSGAAPAELRAFIAQGMLLKIIAGLGAEHSDWVVRLHGSALPCPIEQILPARPAAPVPAEVPAATAAPPPTG